MAVTMGSWPYSTNYPHIGRAFYPAGFAQLPEGAIEGRMRWFQQHPYDKALKDKNKGKKEMGQCHCTLKG